MGTVLEKDYPWRKGDSPAYQRVFFRITRSEVRRTAGVGWQAIDPHKQVTHETRSADLAFEVRGLSLQMA